MVDGGVGRQHVCRVNAETQVRCKSFSIDSQLSPFSCPLTRGFIFNSFFSITLKVFFRLCSRGWCVRCVSFKFNLVKFVKETAPSSVVSHSSSLPSGEQLLHIPVEGFLIFHLWLFFSMLTSLLHSLKNETLCGFSFLSVVSLKGNSKKSTKSFSKSWKRNEVLKKCFSHEQRKKLYKIFIK